MKLKMILRETSLGLIFFCLISSVSAQSVESISGEMLKDVSADEVYWQVSVSCLNVDEPRLMQQRAGDSQWCSIDLPQLCSDSKSSIAEELCSDEYVLFTASDGDNAESLEAASTNDQPAENVETIVEPARQPQNTTPAVPEVSKAAVQATIQPARVEPATVVNEPQVIRSFESPVNGTSVVGSSIVGSSIVGSNASSGIAQNVDSDGPMTAQEMAIEEELIKIEEEMLELRLKEIELESQ